MTNTLMHTLKKFVGAIFVPKGFHKAAGALPHQNEALLFFNHVLTENRCIHSIFHNVPGCFYWKKKDRKYALINGDLEKRLQQYGLTKEQVIGKTDEEIFDSEMARDFRLQDDAVMESGQEMMFDYEVNWHGQKVANCIIKRPVRDEHGQIIGSVGNFVDIRYFERKPLGDELEESELLKLSFIRDMEHDIRTPMSGIVGLSRILYEKEKCLETKENLALIVRSADELLNYCNGILEFSKISRGLYPTVLKSFDLDKLLENLINIEKPAARHKNIQLKIERQEDMPKWVKSDPYRIEKILMNLIGNAIKFTSVGFVSVTIEYKRLYERNIIGYITVTDTGCGIPDTIQTYMYKTFMRGESANRGLSSGIGIGLQVVKEFVHDLGGEIDISSERNRGTKIRLSLPLQISLTELDSA